VQRFQGGRGVRSGRIADSEDAEDFSFAIGVRLVADYDDGLAFLLDLCERALDLFGADR